MNSDFNPYSDNYNALIDSILKSFDKNQLDVLISKIKNVRDVQIKFIDKYL